MNKHWSTTEIYFVHKRKKKIVTELNWTEWKTHTHNKPFIWAPTNIPFNSAMAVHNGSWFQIKLVSMNAIMAYAHLLSAFGSCSQFGVHKHAISPKYIVQFSSLFFFQWFKIRRILGSRSSSRWNQTFNRENKEKMNELLFAISRNHKICKSILPDSTRWTSNGCWNIKKIEPQIYIPCYSLSLKALWFFPLSLYLLLIIRWWTIFQRLFTRVSANTVTLLFTSWMNTTHITIIL